MSSKYSNFELYKSKYLKYKAKYVTLKNMLGGGVEDDVKLFFEHLVEANPHIFQNDKKAEVDKLIKNSAIFKNGKLIDLKLFNMNLRTLPPSIVGLEIMEDLYLQNNNELYIFPENFAEIKVGNNIYTSGITNKDLLKACQNIRDRNNEREMEKKHQYELSQEEIEKRARKAEEIARKAEEAQAKEAFKIKLGDNYDEYMRLIQERDKIIKNINTASPDNNNAVAGFEEYIKEQGVILENIKKQILVLEK